MSGATYRITTAYEPEHDGDTLPWIARVYRISDDEQVSAAFGRDENDAITAARDKIKSLESHTTGRTVYADDRGDLTPDPGLHSVKA